MQSSPVLSLSPSFNNYSSGSRLAEIAARVVEEFREDREFSELDDDLFNFKNEETSSVRAQERSQVEEATNKKQHDDEDGNDDEDDEFEFAFVCREPNSSPISADEIFYNGQIRPVFPIFNRDLLLGDVEIGNSTSSNPPNPSSIRLPLRKLLTEERETPSCSSSDADELDGIPDGMYCAWRPKPAAAKGESRKKCEKSNSTGSSKRWKFGDLLNRSNSDGKANSKVSNVAGKVKVKGAAGAGADETVSATAHEAHYARGRAMKEGDRRRSFLPYRQDVVGFFANVDGLSRNLHSF